MQNSVKLIWIGVALIIIFTIIWLYGDYYGGLFYIWLGVAGIVAGTIVWLVGDYIGGAFKS